MDENSSEITLERRKGYKFLVDFHQKGVEPLLVDEPPPIGEGHGPGATKLLAAAVGNCLSASLIFCLEKAHVEVHDMRTTVRTTKARNEKGRLRVGRIEVTLAPEVAEIDIPRMARCLEIFEEYCTVTGSVRDSIQVDVEVEPVAVTAAAAAR
ncbi:MAG TPA: OsmC family protein [Dehalococcoidia bacterium]|nr:OsmC family protein [Dehalococcoidia bacterium]